MISIFTISIFGSFRIRARRFEAFLTSFKSVQNTEDCVSFFIVQSLCAYLYLVQACFELYRERYRQQTAAEKKKKVR